MREHAGFAIPMILPAIAPVVAAAAFGPTSWPTFTVMGGALLVFGVADALVRYRATRQIRRWAASVGVAKLQKLKRGGFPSWATTLWTFAEMDWYRGTRDDGTPQHVLASTYGPAFGLRVYTFCELRERIEPSAQEHPSC